MSVVTSIEAVSRGVDVERLHAFVMGLRRGDFSVRLPVADDAPWRVREIAVHLNRHAQQMEAMIAEVCRVADEVGIQGKLGPQAEHTFTAGPWRRMMDAVNTLAANLTEQVRDLNQTVAQLNRGDTTRPVTCDCQGEMLALKDGVNALATKIAAR